ncbi:hypothetical protein AAG906_005155 [Vitis piasezkii]
MDLRSWYGGFNVIVKKFLNCPTAGTLFMEGQMQARDQDNSGEMHDFNLTTILTAMNCFSDANKLGEGEIAVKRLSRKSGQGLEGFKNEVMLIVKLQHKNLVRLLGCCIGERKSLLVYELGQACCHCWGITREILYLHDDSRLKIIHRDLKASNILLDEEMNPRI